MSRKSLPTVDDDVELPREEGRSSMWLGEPEAPSFLGCRSRSEPHAFDDGSISLLPQAAVPLKSMLVLSASGVMTTIAAPPALAPKAVGRVAGNGRRVARLNAVDVDAAERGRGREPVVAGGGRARERAEEGRAESKPEWEWEETRGE